MFRVGDLRPLIDLLPDDAVVAYYDGWNWLPVDGAGVGYDEETQDGKPVQMLQLYYDH